MMGPENSWSQGAARRCRRQPRHAPGERRFAARHAGRRQIRCAPRAALYRHGLRKYESARSDRRRGLQTRRRTARSGIEHDDRPTMRAERRVDEPVARLCRWRGHHGLGNLVQRRAVRGVSAVSRGRVAARTFLEKVVHGTACVLCAFKPATRHAQREVAGSSTRIVADPEHVVDNRDLDLAAIRLRQRHHGTNFLQRACHEFPFSANLPRSERESAPQVMYGARPDDRNVNSRHLVWLAWSACWLTLAPACALATRPCDTNWLSDPPPPPHLTWLEGESAVLSVGPLVVARAELRDGVRLTHAAGSDESLAAIVRAENAKEPEFWRVSGVIALDDECTFDVDTRLKVKGRDAAIARAAAALVIYGRARAAAGE